MDVKEIINLIQGNMSNRESILKAKKYYENKNDILDSGVLPLDNNGDALRSADNRISHNFHQLMVDEKAAYMFTYPIQFDLDNNTDLNEEVESILGDEKESIAQELCVEASNAGRAFLHYWIDEDDKSFNYAVVNAEEIITKYDNTLKKKLVEVYRYFELIEDDNVSYVIFEHWTNNRLTEYKLKGNIDSSDLKLVDTKLIEHDFGRVPFIEFKNNKNCISDLNKYKTLIDLTDKVMSGYANDMEDIQQLIYILEGYGGQDLQEFKNDLRRFKAIKVDGGADGGSVKTLQIDIPVEARVKIIEILEKRIYEAGQALQQDTESVGNASGVALKFFYRKLELKAGKTETEFKKGFNVLIRAILKYLNKDVKKIIQTYTRNMISNDLETAQIAAMSVGFIPEKLTVKNHPWSENADKDYEELVKERQAQLVNSDDYSNLEDNNNE